MAVRDIEAYLRERAVIFDPNIDASSGSPFDVAIIQPLLRRLGTDPFTTDLKAFIEDRLKQAHPELATGDGDVISDLLAKPAVLLWDPIVREIKRVSNNLSFRDPSTLTTDEADSLGGTFFEERRRGKYAKGVARLLFSQPQNIAITPVNFVTSKGGLRFLPTELQSIRTAEMILNVTADGLYYFDINVIAEKPGSEYSIGPNEVISISNVPAAVRALNSRRFIPGEDEENAVAYAGRLEQSLSERSLVTQRGITAKLLNSFPEVNRLNIVGMGDPEMQRDIIRGGGLGPIIAAGTGGEVVPDGEGKIRSRRFSVLGDGIDLIETISGTASSWVITVVGAFGSADVAKDITVRRVVSSSELELEDQDLIYSTDAKVWMLRKKEITLSGIPGGILFPDSQNGTVAVPDDTIHIGGATDVHVRGTAFDELTLAIDNVTDDEPLLKGSELSVDTYNFENVVYLNELVLNATYEEGDETYKQLENAAFYGYTLQIIEGVDAGNFRIIDVSQVSGQPARLRLDPAPSNPGTSNIRWRLFDAINVDLVNPRETRIEGEDLKTTQGVDVVDTTSGTNFDDYGVAEGDTLRIIDGSDAADYQIIEDPIAPSFSKLKLDRKLTHSGADLQYVIFRPNLSGGVQRPLVRITKIELLDSSSQPVGSTVPYARPVDVQSRAFQNPSRGLKHDLRDVRLGLVSTTATVGGVAFSSVAGQTLTLRVDGVEYTFTLSASGQTPAQVVADLNSQGESLLGMAQIAVQLGTQHFGIRPIADEVELVAGTARTPLFGDQEYRSTRDVRSATVEEQGGWPELSPIIDLTTRLDIIQVVDGQNVGYFEAPYLLELDMTDDFPVTTVSTALVVSSSDTFKGFAPEISRHVQIGARSLGSARVFFLDPTSFEVDEDARFRLTTDSGELEFLPDPTLRYQRVPPLPSGTVPKDGESFTVANLFSSSSQDFVKSGIRPGDVLVVKNHPIAGDVVVGDPVVGLVYMTFIFSLDGGPDRTLTFIRDDISLNSNEVSRSGVVDQINAAAGEEICALTATNTLEFDTTRDLIIRGTGTANPLILGTVAGTSPQQSFVGADQTNASPHAGEYEIALVDVTTLTTAGDPFGSAFPYSSPMERQSFYVYRNGVQRITTTSMAKNGAEAGLYYFDVELISLGTGDQWNIDRGLQLTVDGFRADGFYLTTSDENLSFSTTESLGLILSRSVLENGVDDDPQNATQLSGQNLQITYERAPLVGDVQGFISSDEERVVCASPLSRHLVPNFVRFDVKYSGGSRESVVQPEIETYVRDLFPQDALESSDVQRLLLNRGATSITNPIDLIGVVHYPDRRVYVVRSQDGLTAGRLTAFIPDRITITRNLI